MKTKSVDLFTKEEHSIISDWLRVKPKCDDTDLPYSWDALETLGYVGKASGYGEEDAAVADMVLERIKDTLPQWSAFRSRGTAEEESTLIVGREARARKARRKIELVPQYLLTVNWADSGPGFSWPVAYHATWVPIYDVYVVTQSADCPDAFGYCDFAIGHFPATGNIVKHATEQLRSDWEWQRDQFCQNQWVYLFGSGLIDKEKSLLVRQEVWSDEAA